MENNASPIEILLIEDNPGDVKLTQLGLKEAKVSNNLSIVNNGIDALNYLYKRGEFAFSTRPDLILLDLNLPLKDGRAVLEEIKENENLKTIPVVILTSSKAEEDILKSYKLHANCFITKPLDLTQFLAVIAAIDEFWLTIVKLPK